MTSELPFQHQLRRRREAQGWSQKELADRIGVSQAAISQFENGSSTALSKEHVEILCRELGVPMEEARPAAVVAYCPQADCAASTRIVQKQGKLTIRPVFYRVEPGTPRFCRTCGTGLQSCCREETCGQPVQADALFCTHCGTGLVGAPEFVSDVVDYAERRNEVARMLDDKRREPEALPKRVRVTNRSEADAPVYSGRQGTEMGDEKGGVPVKAGRRN